MRRKQNARAASALDPAETERAELNSVLIGLAHFRAVCGFEHSEQLRRLPHQLATSGEACAALRNFFPGGIAEVREVLDAVQPSLDAARAVIASIDKTVW